MQNAEKIIIMIIFFIRCDLRVMIDNNPQSYSIILELKVSYINNAGISYKYN